VGDDAFQKFERMCRKVEQTEAETDALLELSNPWNLDTSFVGDADTSEAEIDAELAALKDKPRSEV
jgi:phage shock protein A